MAIHAEETRAMMHVNAIETALAAHDIDAIEMAFQALVDYPHAAGIDGAKSVDVLCSLLARITRALQQDHRAMPAVLGASIAAALDDATGTVADYAAGARIVSDHAYRWRGMFLQHALATGRV